MYITGVLYTYMYIDYRACLGLSISHIQYSALLTTSLTNK